MNNRVHNCKNPYQGNTKKVLCVCSAGLLRSPTAAKVLGEKYGFNTRSCGVDVDHALIPIDNVLLHWADEVVCMDKRQGEIVQDLLEVIKDTTTNVFILNIPDRYSYNEPELVTLINKQYADILMLLENHN